MTESFVLSKKLSIYIPEKTHGKEQVNICMKHLILPTKKHNNTSSYNVEPASLFFQIPSKAFVLKFLFTISDGACSIISHLLECMSVFCGTLSSSNAALRSLDLLQIYNLHTIIVPLKYLRDKVCCPHSITNIAIQIPPIFLPVLDSFM